MKSFKAVRAKLAFGQTPVTGTDSASSNRSSAQDVGNQATHHEEAEPLLQQLNEELQILADVFPNVPTSSLRHLLITSSAESRLYLISEALITRRTLYVEETLPLHSRMLSRQNGALPAQAVVEDHELIRSKAYKAAVKQASYYEFPKIRQSRINHILSESNWSYSATRPLLSAESEGIIVSKLSKFFSHFERRPLLEHPALANWPCEDELEGPLPAVRPNVQKEFAQELEATLIDPTRLRRLERQQEEDRLIAERLNEEEAEQHESMYECQCCFSDVSFEQVTACCSGHFLCARCVQHSLSEALYGQNWALSIDEQRGTMKCMAASAADPCDSWIPLDQLTTTLNADKTGQDLLQKLDQELCKRSVLDISVLKCSSCQYAEVAPPPQRTKWTHHPHIGVGVLVLVIFNIGLQASRYHRLDHCLGIASAVSGFLVQMYITGYRQQLEKSKSALDGLPDDRGQKFICRNPSCAAISCLNCLGPWVDPHRCFADRKMSLREYVEAAVSAAIKRTCPRCRIAFVKASGCNKMMCRCGYSMCYLCKADLTKEKYAHFCNHFRPMGGQCTECDKCSLYKEVNEAAVISEAREKAEKEWWDMERERRAAGGTGAPGLVDRMKATVGKDGGLFVKRKIE